MPLQGRLDCVRRVQSLSSLAGQFHQGPAAKSLSAAGLEVFESDPEVIRDAPNGRLAHVRTYQLGPYVEFPSES